MRRAGQSIMEILVAIGVGVIMIAAGAAIIAPALTINSTATQAQAAAAIGKELFDNVRVVSEENWQSIATSTVATTSAYHYRIDTSVTPFTIRSGDENITVGTTTYMRYFYIDDVPRVAGSPYNNDVLMGGGASDPSTKLVTVVYGWSQSGGQNYRKTISGYLTRYRNMVYVQTDWSGGPNQSGPASTTNREFATSTNIDYSTTTGSILIPL